MSTPSSFHGSFDGSRSAITLIGPRPRSIDDFVVLILPGKGPWTLSYFSSSALASTEPRSLIATTSMSLRSRFRDGAQHQPPDPPESVNRNAHSHFFSRAFVMSYEIFRQPRLGRGHGHRLGA